MKKFNLFPIIFIIVFSLSTLIGYSQDNNEKDSVLLNLNDHFPIPDKFNRKNSISLNITNPLLLSIQFQTVAYERILKNNQSFSVSFGKFSLPKFGDDLADSLGMNTDYSDKGLHVGFDYRFYLKKENKYAAPRGVYIGPFYTYNYLNRENSWYLDGHADEVFTNLKFNIHTVGVELGYQFVFWDRMSIDMILMGPGVGFYGLKTELGTNMDPEKEEEFFQKLNDLLADKIPGYDNILEPGDFTKSGSFNTVDVGFRYVVRIGYRF
jgi:hypothetical protein